MTDGKFNDAPVRHVLDEKNEGVFDSHTPVSVTFKDAKKFDVQNPIKDEDEKIRRRLEALWRQDDEDGGGGGGSDRQHSPPPLPVTKPTVTSKITANIRWFIW